MVTAQYTDKSLVIEILTKAFIDNKSVNYVVRQDKRISRIKNLMAYSFDVCFLFGKVYLTEDKTGCALVLFPDKKKNNLKSILLDLKLIVNCIGISSISTAVHRESKIKKTQLSQKELMYYLWFIGVDPSKQRNGAGSRLLQQILEESSSMKRAVFLETSTTTNLPWYKRFGFKTYAELDFGYQLYFLKNVT